MRGRNGLRPLSKAFNITVMPEMLATISAFSAESGQVPIAASTVGTALIAAGASIFGGVVTGFFSLRTQRASQHAVREDERGRAERASKAAWTLLGIEIGNAHDAVYEIRRTRQWPIGWHRTWSTAWRDCRETLLLQPPEDDRLRPVAFAIARIDELENGVNTQRSEEERDLSGEDQLFLWRMQGVLESACEALDYRSKEARPEDPTTDEIEEWQRESGGGESRDDHGVAQSPRAEVSGGADPTQ
jgi:hypothetical protein